MSQSNVSVLIPSAPIAAGKLWWASLAAGAAGAVVNTLVFLIANGPLGLNVQVAQPGSEPMPLMLPFVIISSLVPSFGAAVLLALLNRFTKRPVLIFEIIAVVFLLLSFGAPLNLPVDMNSKLVLWLMHVVAGVAIMILLPRLSRAR